jgi:hypothetical protein
LAENRVPPPTGKKDGDDVIDAEFEVKEARASRLAGVPAGRPLCFCAKLGLVQCDGNGRRQGGAIMNLTMEQERAIQRGQAVRVIVAGSDCVLVRRDIFDRANEMDYEPWTADETNLLAADTADLLAGDGFDEPDDS